MKDDPSPAFRLDPAADLKMPLAAAVRRQLYRVAQAQRHGREDWTTGLFWTLRAPSQS